MAPEAPPPALEGALRAVLAPQFTVRRWGRFVRSGGRPEDLAGGTKASVRAVGTALGMGPREAAALARELRRTAPERELAHAAAAGVRVVAWGSGGYPPALRELPDPPPALYLRGELLDCDRRAVAVVGSRRATAYGLRIARVLATDLARAGVSVVAGLARGIDAAAHEGALHAGGRTLAVLGSGMLRPYPSEHVDLAGRVAASGALVSEFALDAPPQRRHFPQRNRLIAALSAAVVVVEAGGRSGALSTVGHALDLGRPVLAVPGPVDAETSQGTLRLLREGAAPAGGAEDVFAALDWCGAPRTDLPAAEQAVLDALGEGGASALDVAARLGMPEEAAAGYLVTLEVRGLVQREQGGRYAVI